MDGHPRPSGEGEEAATLVEYGLLLAFVAVAVVLAVAAVGVDMFDSFDTAHQELDSVQPAPITP